MTILFAQRKKKTYQTLFNKETSSVCTPKHYSGDFRKEQKKKPRTYWTMPKRAGDMTTVVVYVDKNDGGVSVVESFEINCRLCNFKFDR